MPQYLTFNSKGKDDLYAGLPHAPGYTILREINVVADHNAYHIGKLAILRQVMDAWSN